MKEEGDDVTMIDGETKETNGKHNPGESTERLAEDEDGEPKKDELSDSGSTPLPTSSSITIVHTNGKRLM